MRVLVYAGAPNIVYDYVWPVELAAALRDFGHDVMMFGRPGPHADTAARRGLRTIAVTGLKKPRTSSRGILALRQTLRSTPQMILELRRAVRREQIELVHAYGTRMCIESFFGAYVGLGVPVLCTHWNVAPPRNVPGPVPLVVGTPHRENEARRSRSSQVWLLRTPVDVEQDHPSVDASAFREAYQLGDSLNVVIVSRLVPYVKLEGLVAAMEAMRSLSEELPVRLVIVGGGPIYDRLLQRAEEINSGLGRRAIILTGWMEDPRPAYAAADVVIGMGNSVLRGMAFQKPAIIVGEQGFAEIVTRANADRMLAGRVYGIGNGEPMAQRLHKAVRELLIDESLRIELGQLCRAIVLENFSLGAAAKTLGQIYEEIRETAIMKEPSLRTRMYEGARFAAKASLEAPGAFLRAHRREAAIERGLLG